jgi:sugar/nucleoside kinase (ribokinase family)
LPHIVVIGSVARDDVVRLTTPLRPGAHLNGCEPQGRLGGGGANTAVALAAAGHYVSLVAAVGQDEIAEALLEELGRAGVDTSQVVRVAGATTRSLVLVDPDGERTVVNVARSEEDAPPARLLELEADAVYVRSRRVDLAPLLARKADECLVVAHVPPADSGSRPAQVLVCSAADLVPAEACDPLALGRRVAGDRLNWIVTTEGPAGATALSAAEVVHAPAEPVPTVDTTGAGDAFAAGLVHGLVCGLTMRDALILAVRFGTEATRWESSGLPAPAVGALLA